MSGAVGFFFEQKTAYEMRISDWSSDVCSSDLAHTLSLGFTVPRNPSRARHERVTELLNGGSALAFRCGYGLLADPRGGVGRRGLQLKARRFEVGEIIQADADYEGDGYWVVNFAQAPIPEDRSTEETP